MARKFSEMLLWDVEAAVTGCAAENQVVDVVRIAENIRVQNLAENVAREDIERLVVEHAENRGLIMAFGTYPPELDQTG